MKIVTLLIVASVAIFEAESFDLGLQASPHIVSGEEARQNAYPFQAALFIRKPDGPSFCGGVLLTYQWILTAAQCMEHATQGIALLGAHKIFEDEEDSQPVRITQIIIHPGYNNKTLKNDIALIGVNVQMIDELVYPIRLPKISQKQISFWRSPVTMTGWGTTKDGKASLSPVLRQVSSRIVSNFYCNLRFFTTQIDESMICASGWWAKGTCVGDFGGPLFIQEEDSRNTLIGIASWVSRFGCEKSFPIGFTRVTNFLPWIYEITGLNPR